MVGGEGRELIAMRCNNEKQPMVMVYSGAGIQHKKAWEYLLCGYRRVGYVIYRNGDKEGVPGGGFGMRCRCNWLRGCFD